MTDVTPRAGAPLLAANQAQKNVTHNEALYQFDALMCARFLDRDLSIPPSSPADGDTYLIKATATGTWSGQDGKIAYCADGAWRFYTPFAGLVAYVTDESDLIVFNGTSWVDYASLLALENLPLLGVNTTADSTNKLAVQSNAALFTDLPTGSGGSGDIRITVNKQTASNTASFLFQDNFSGRAEMGLTGDDNFHFKVSPDGSAWTTAIQIAAATGQVTLASPDSGFTLLNSADATKLAQFSLANITTGTTRIYTLPNVTGVLATVGNFTQTFTGPTTFSNATVTVGSATTAATYGFGTGATTSGNTKTISIGTLGASGSTTNITLGSSTSGAGGTVTFSSAVALSPANANVAISPTGTGTVTVSPAGALTIAPTAASTINNCSVGVTTAAAGVFTTLQATTSLKLPTTANGAVATTMTSLGPTGSHTTVQEWFAILNASGSTRYVPAY